MSSEKAEEKTKLPFVGTTFPAWGIAQLKEVGLVGVVPSHLPEKEALPLADALLAAPVLISVVQVVAEPQLALLSDIRSQARELMLVGADISGMGGASQTSLVDPLAAVREAMEAGAHFLIVSGSQAAVCVAHRIPHIPIATSINHLNNLAKTSTLVAAGVACMELAKRSEAYSQLDIIVKTSKLSVSDLRSYCRHGAAAVMTPLWFAGQPSMRPTIVRAREFSAAWQKEKQVGNVFSAQENGD